MEFSKKDLEDRLERLRTGGQFGCTGRHWGNGDPECPKRIHHHHDIFCLLPLDEEIRSIQNLGG